MSRRVIVTRPLEDSIAFAEKLRATGHDVIIAPLLEIAFKTGVVLPHEGVQAVVFTSANGVHGVAAQANADELLDKLAIAIGPASAAAAKAAGFTRVSQANGDVSSVIETVRERCKAGQESILYLSGVHTAGDLENELTASGYVVHRVVVYEAVHASELPTGALEALASQDNVAIVLFSPRTAHIWCSLVEQDILHGTGAKTVNYYCLSHNVARVIGEHSSLPGNVIVASQPNEQAMIDVLSGRQT